MKSRALVSARLAARRNAALNSQELQTASAESAAPAPQDAYSEATASERFRAHNRLSTLDRANALQRATQVPTKVVYQDAQTRVISDTTLSAADAQSLATEIQKALAYDTQVVQWSNTAPLNHQLTIQALSKPGFDQVLGGDSTGVAGVTLGPGQMAVPADLIQNLTPDGKDTLAHEGKHNQDFLQAGAQMENIPRYLQEGQAYVIGDSYPISLGEDKNDPALPGIAKSLGTYTAQDASDVLAHYRTGQDSAAAGANGFRDEIMGALFVEFLRTRLNGSGVADARKRLGQVTEDVGAGQSFDAAFQKQFGMASSAAESAFVQYVKATESNPAARLQGTLWAPYLPPAGPAPIA